MNEKQKVKYLKDYAEPNYQVEQIQMEFDLDPSDTKVKVITTFMPKEGFSSLKLDADELELISVKLNDLELTEKDYKLDEDSLVILNPPKEKFKLEIENIIHPNKNTALSGLYISNDMFCTQCEPEGFRRITYYPDHSDIMAKFQVKVSADKLQYPVLLSNGNVIDKGDLGNGKHFAVFEDPFKKPSYLFALVAGDLSRVSDTFITSGGRKVDIGVYTEKGKENKAWFALESLKKAMSWDEEKWGREYDLDVFNIVAVSAFNQGAMENKSLNIFNDKYVLANAQTATDADYENIEGVVAHEYFHNWTGDRVTLKNWFNLTLKEGLTVFRDQEFSSDMRSRPIKRIDDVSVIKIAQFTEDASPLAHPIMPKSYVEIDNFYTATVYDKGAEVIRMTKHLLGEEKFRKATDLYFDRHDGQAVTTDDWLKSMEDGSGIDLTQFKFWYDQEGTPNVIIKEEYNQETKLYKLLLKQEIKEGQKPFVIPIKIGLLSYSGVEILKSQVIVLNKFNQEFSFENIQEKPILSFNRDFTSPINVELKQNPAEFAVLMASDIDEFNRYDAGQAFALSLFKDIILKNDAANKESFLKALSSYLFDEKIDKQFAAFALILPTERVISNNIKPIPVDEIHQIRKDLSKEFAQKYEEKLLEIYNQNQVNEPYQPTPEQIGKRALKNVALSYLCKLGEKYLSLAYQQYKTAENMTDKSAALSVIVNNNASKAQEMLSDFYETYKNDDLLMQKWLQIQAFADKDDVIEDVKHLMKHKVFDIKNPNKIYALIFPFCGNNKAFHKKDGSGYNLLKELVLELNPINPHMANKLLKALCRFKDYDVKRQDLMKNVLLEIKSTPKINPGALELIEKSL